MPMLEGDSSGALEPHRGLLLRSSFTSAFGTGAFASGSLTSPTMKKRSSGSGRQAAAATSPNGASHLGTLIFTGGIRAAASCRAHMVRDRWYTGGAVRERGKTSEQAAGG